MTDSVYAKPVAPRIVVRPALATLVIHALVVAVLAVNWDGVDDRTISKAKIIPKVINARLVDASELKPKKVARPPVKTTPKARSKPRSKAKPAQKVIPKTRAKPKPKAKPAPPKVVEKVQPRPEPRLTPAELSAIARADLSRVMESEEQEQAALTSDELAASYAALIRQSVVGYWSRPPSARNGMEVLLALQLIPTGEVVSVTVVKSSGNTAFDRSAINAVEKAEQFPELKDLPPREFEKTFRRFRLLFRPEDLRY